MIPLVEQSVGGHVKVGDQEPSLPNLPGKGRQACVLRRKEAVPPTDSARFPTLSYLTSGVGQCVVVKDSLAEMFCQLLVPGGPSRSESFRSAHRFNQNRQHSYNKPLISTETRTRRTQTV